MFNWDQEARATLEQTMNILICDRAGKLCTAAPHGNAQWATVWSLPPVEAGGDVMREAGMDFPQ